ncbi:hypothetical protein F2P56_013112 [Juglans regia]|uniref:CCHC-type domain-containing protein n=1 Tax=Juglans regia TaxID=51240 RepID=A0A833XJG6_JUGRE|nr:hypothetical protein F2P56_013112 [Juglans regia]
MIDVLEEQYASLSLTEKESEEVVVDINHVEEVLSSGENCLIMQLLTRKHYNHEVFKQTMRKVWRTVKGVKIRDLNSDFSLAEFEDVKDKVKVLREGPWAFDKQLVLLKEFDGLVQAKGLTIVHVPFWVRIYDLPLMARNSYVGKLIGSLIGEFLEVDLAKGEFEWGEFMRVRVLLDISTPLQRRKKLKLGDENYCWVRLVYERLPDFCYQCGLLGHSLRECAEFISVNAEIDQLPYGAWLRAGFSSPKRGWQVGAGARSKEGSRNADPPQPMAVEPAKGVSVPPVNEGATAELVGNLPLREGASITERVTVGEKNMGPVFVEKLFSLDSPVVAHEGNAKMDKGRVGSGDTSNSERVGGSVTPAINEDHLVDVPIVKSSEMGLGPSLGSTEVGVRHPGPHTQERGRKPTKEAAELTKGPNCCTPNSNSKARLLENLQQLVEFPIGH